MADVKITALPAGTAQPTGILPVVNGGVTQRVTVKSIVDLATASMPSGTVDTTASGGLVGITSSPNLSIQQWSDEMSLKAAFQNRGVEFRRIDLTGPGDPGDLSGGEGWIYSTAGAFGRLYYGSANRPLPGQRADDPGVYEMPTPTGDGYLRADQDPATGWYFAEPVVISDTQPPTPPGDPALPTIWAKPVDAASAPASKGITLAQVQSEIDAKLAALPAGEAVDTAAIAAAILPDIRKTLNGGVVPPPDITTWTTCPIIAAIQPGPQTSTVEAIQLNGVLYLRGSFEMAAGQTTQASQGGLAYLQLPPAFARPSVVTRAFITGRTSPTATVPVLGAVNVRTNGWLSVACGGCDTVYFDGATVRII
jgi:hypothetical protein